MSRLTLFVPLAFCAALSSPVAAAGTAAPPSGDVRAALDGKVFITTIDVEQYDKPFDDRIVFDAGTFFSEECQRRCDFGTGDYYTRVEGDGIAFVAEMACADAPHFVRWEGRVTGDRIEGEVLWVVERFYWTQERQATFSGRLEDGPERQAAILTE